MLVNVGPLFRLPNIKSTLVQCLLFAGNSLAIKFGARGTCERTRIIVFHTKNVTSNLSNITACLVCKRDKCLPACLLAACLPACLPACQPASLPACLPASTFTVLSYVSQPMLLRHVLTHFYKVAGDVFSINIIRIFVFLMTHSWRKKNWTAIFISHRMKTDSKRNIAIAWFCMIQGYVVPCKIKSQ